MNIVKFLRTAFLRTPLVTASDSQYFELQFYVEFLLVYTKFQFSHITAVFLALLQHENSFDFLC